MTEATGAQIVVKLLEMQGISLTAGIPGSSILPLYDALLQSSIEHFLVRHEQAGGFLAQGIARSTGIPAVCFATSGPGAMNLLTAIADARADSIPLVAITGQVATEYIGTDAFQEADTFGLSLPITKHSILVKDASELLSVIPYSFQVAMSGRKGPVLIDIPLNVQSQKITFENWPVLNEIWKVPNVKGTVSNRKCLINHSVNKNSMYRTEGNELVSVLENFAKVLLDAKNPVLFVGGGCNSELAATAISQFLDVFPMNVVSSLMGLGAVSSQYENFVGMTGVYGLPEANNCLHNADVVLAAGVRFDERAMGGKSTKELNANSTKSFFSSKTKILHIDIDPAEIDKIVDSTYSVAAAVETSFPILTSFMKKKELLNNPIKHVAQTEGQLLINTIANTLNNIALIRNQPELSSKEVYVTTDVGLHQMWVAQAFPFEKPRHFLTSGSLGTMGFGLPAAIGVALSHKKNRVLCFSGDGSILMNIQELATLAELWLDVTIIVIDNDSLGMVRQIQNSKYNHRYSASNYKKPSNIACIAESFGIPSRHVGGNEIISSSLGKKQDKLAPLVISTQTEWENFAFPNEGEGPRLIQCQISRNWH